MTVTAISAKKSTTVRSFTEFSLKATRLAFGVLEWTAPNVGAKWAERVWFTVPPRTGKAPAQPEPGRRLEVRLGSGARMVGESWGTGPVVYLMHGWGGRRSDLGALVGPLTAAGYRVVAFDGPSHGESEPGPSGPGRATFLEFGEMLVAVAAVEGPPHALVAHSGGAMSAAFALLGGLQVERLVFIAPWSQVAGYTRGFARRLGFGERIRNRFLRRLEQRFALPLSTFENAAVAAIERRVSPPPLLIVHDRDDKETAYADSEALVQAWPGARLVTTTGRGHRRILRAPEAIGRVVDFVDAAPTQPAAAVPDAAAS